MGKGRELDRGDGGAKVPSPTTVDTPRDLPCGRHIASSNTHVRQYQFLQISNWCVLFGNLARKSSQEEERLLSYRGELCSHWFMQVLEEPLIYTKMVKPNRHYRPGARRRTRCWGSSWNRGEALWFSLCLWGRGCWTSRLWQRCRVAVMNRLLPTAKTTMREGTVISPIFPF